jgi:hypothetical protein
MDNTYGWVYKIINSDTKKAIYIGSTCCIQSRIATHKNATNCHTSPRYNKPMYQYIRANGGFYNYKVTVHWQGTIASRRELCQREQELIDEFNDDALLFNKRDAILDPVKSAQNARERSLKYYHDHRDRINRHVQCPCGAFITYNGRTMHSRTQKHLSFEPFTLSPLFSWVE